MNEIESNKWYIVKPSVVIDDRMEDFKKGLQKHIVTFKTKSDDVSAAISCFGGYKDLLIDRHYYSSIGNHCLENEYYVNVYKKIGEWVPDVFKYIEYDFLLKIGFELGLWEVSTKIENFLLEKKPSYSLPEIKKIIDDYKEELIMSHENWAYKFTVEQIIKDGVVRTKNWRKLS